jgi:hypothetical protein
VAALDRKLNLGKPNYFPFLERKGWGAMKLDKTIVF